MRAPNRSRNAYLNARRLEKLNKRASMLYGELAAQGDAAWRAQTDSGYAVLALVRTQAELLAKIRDLLQIVVADSYPNGLDGLHSEQTNREAA